MNWIELAIVAVVLAVLAALVVPQFSQAGTDPREQELRSAVQVVRGQIEMYRLQHDNQYPTLRQFTEQMTQPSNSRGQTPGAAGNGCDLGPYLRSVPVNPYLGTNDVAGTRGGTSAWVYDEKTGEFQPNRPESR